VLNTYLHRKVQMKNISPSTASSPALKSGRIGLIISAMTETPERAEFIEFLDPYLRTGLSLLLKQTGFDGADIRTEEFGDC
jgi:polar amino acid transport system substrate-binding protein